MDKKRLNIIILNWNGKKDTIECLNSIAKIDYPDYQVIVVDNGSTDGSPTVIKGMFPAITVLENKENLGFAGGNNVGIRFALNQGADYILLLNNDTIVEPDFLNTLIRVAETDERIGILGPKIYFFSDPSRFWHIGGKIDWRLGRASYRGYGQIDYGQLDMIEDVDYVTGCALLVKKDVFETVGLLDEQYFLYYEEIDFCIRAKKVGFRVVYVPEAKIWHKAFASSGGETAPIYVYYTTRNRLLFMRKYMTDSRWILFLICFFFNSILRRTIFIFIKSRWRGKSLKALWSGWRDFHRNRFYRGPDWLHRSL